MAQTVFGIYGLGLIGGSIAVGIKKYIPDSKIIGFGRNIEKLEKAKAYGVIDDYTTNDINMVSTLDYFVIGTPADLVESVFTRFMPDLKDEVVIMDVSSVKRKVINDIKQANKRGLRFIPSHPMAGSEKSGIEYVNPDLFKKKIVAIVSEGNEDMLETVRDFWKALGAQIVLVSADFHDEIVSETSHTPHLISASLSNFLQKDGWGEIRFFGLYGKGLLDMTRIAKGNPEMWADITLDNSDNVERSLKAFNREIEALIKLIKEKKRKDLIDFLENARKFRETL